jgi:SAM-dependent methyltransferase
MHFSYKLAKLTKPASIRSAKRHLGRLLLTRRSVFGIDADQVIASMDRENFQAIYHRYAVDNPGFTWRKFLDLEKWMEINVRRVRDLELDYGRRREILDIGSGAGYFLYICKWLGHDALGLDIERVPMYPEMARLFELQRVIWRVEPFVPLPDLGRKFDLITAFKVCFNKSNRNEIWGKREWDFFLDDLGRHLKRGGRVWLDLNRQPDGTLMSSQVRRLFESRGARIDRCKVMFASAPRVSAAS